MDIRRRSLLSETLHGGGSSEGLINIDNYLTIEAIEDGLTAKLSKNACEYCVDGDGNWKSLAAGTATESINSGHTLSFRGELTPNSSNGIGIFTISKKCNLKGNCMSMLFGDNAADNFSLEGKFNTFYKLFYGCSNIINISNNFLPATTLAGDCYYRMFQGCTNLLNTPDLPATTLAGSCYSYMFCGCNKLNYIKMLATDISASNCLFGWVDGVASSGTFVKHPDMTDMSRGIEGIPIEWTVVYDGGESVVKPINVLRLKPKFEGGTLNIMFSFDFPPTSTLNVYIKTDGFGGNFSTLFHANNQSGEKFDLDMGVSNLMQIISYTPAEDDTYIYEIIIEQ